jgi:hypothetical protein
MIFPTHVLAPTPVQSPLFKRLLVDNEFDMLDVRRRI